MNRDKGRLMTTTHSLRSPLGLLLIGLLVATVSCQAVPTPTPPPSTSTPLPTSPPSTPTAIPPTSTPIPPSPTPRPTADLVLSEEFADPSSFWCQKGTGTVDMYCQDGELHMVSKSQTQFQWKGRPNSYRDFMLQVQVRFIGNAGAAALVFRASSGTSPSMYVSWVFPTGQGSLMKYTTGNRVNLIPPTQAPAIKKGEAANLLKMVAQGSRFAFYANDIELVQVTDASYPEGLVGIGAADGAHVVFDNLKIWVPLTTSRLEPVPTSNPFTETGARKRYSFEDIVPHLDTPTSLLAFMSNNLRHGGNDYDQIHYGGNAYATAQEVYANGEDDCDGLAEFGACVLSKHGFESYNVGISIGSPLGHNVAGFVNPVDGKMYAINNVQERAGPFNSWVELAQYFIDRGYAEPNKEIWLFAPCINQTTSDVRNLPHKVIR